MGDRLECMSEQHKADLRRYLQEGREAIVWKLVGLSEYDVRRPLTPTGTNLLGLVKHLAGVEAEYFGVVFNRPFEQDLPWWRATSNPVTLGRVLVHVTAETHRHAGHADIVRELVDGNVGHREGNDNMAGGDQTWWRDYRDHLESIARKHPGPEPTAP